MIFGGITVPQSIDEKGSAMKNDLDLKFIKGLTLDQVPSGYDPTKGTLFDGRSLTSKE